uniref:Sorting nexin 2 n=1 Tax=Callorhinchus milii TaxID=7868 RepID=A0A4W3ICD4_CALMI
MAAEREPPPFGDVEAEDSEFRELDEGEDLFVSTASTLESSPSSPEPASLPAEDISAKSNGPKSPEILLDDDREDLFAEATEEVSLDSPEREAILSPEPSPAITPVTPTLVTPRSELKMISTPMFDRSKEELEEEANGDTFDIHVSVSDPEKVGKFYMHVLFSLITQTSSSMFSSREFTVKRRFSDFLGLHDKLSTKYMHIGYIVPPAPEKSIVGMTKVKVGKEDSSSTEFVEKRRAALERYLQRTVKHPTLLQDPDLRQFLESNELPRAVNTQALSGAGILRMVNKAADAVNKMTIKMNESDAWFEEKQQQFENLDQQLRKLHTSVDLLVCHRKVFDHRMKCWQKWEAEAKLQFANKPDKMQQAKEEIREWEARVQQGERDFEQISKTIRKEIGRFEKERVKDFKTVIIKYLESLVQTQQQVNTRTVMMIKWKSWGRTLGNVLFPSWNFFNPAFWGEL